MKQIILVLLSLPLFSNAQNPIAVANAHVLTEREGYTGFNYATIYQGPSGKVYTRTYDGDIAIHGNNYTIPLTKISRLAAQSGIFFEKNNNETIFFDSKKIVIIKADTVYKIIDYPKESLVNSIYKNAVIVFIANSNFVETYLLEGEKLVKKSADSKNRKEENTFVYTNNKGEIYTYSNLNDSLIILKLNDTTFQFQKVGSYNTGKCYLQQIDDEKNFIIRTRENNGICYQIKNGEKQIAASKMENYNLSSIQTMSYPFGLTINKNNYYRIFNLTNDNENLPTILTRDNLNLSSYENNYGSFYSVTSNKPMRIFTTINKYPNIFNSADASSIFSLQQDNDGKIWAGSYKGGVAIIDNANSQEIKNLQQTKISNGGFYFNNKMYFNTEGIPNGIIEINSKKEIKQKVHDNFGFFNYVTKDKKNLYYGTGGYSGLWQLETSELEKEKLNWNKIDSNKGVKLHNILTITEDSVGRIWCGHPKRGIAIYNPTADKAQTWLIDKEEIKFGVMSSITDYNGTVWLGSDTKGLWYYNDYTKEASGLNCKQINHPLLNSGKTITALTIYKNWLVIGGYDKMMLLNLDSFYYSQKIIVRYLNPIEANFSSFTEQNTLLTSKKDSSIWFSTSDMLYQWDIKNWLKLPTYNVNINGFVDVGNTRIKLSLKKRTSLNAGTNTFDIAFEYLSPDGMPRYTRTALIKTGDSVQYGYPNLESIFNFKNLSSGDYIFYVEVFEQNGITSHYEYNLSINKYFWQQWWFWLLTVLLLCTPVALLLNTKRKNAVQQKQLSQMKVVTLSNQFRPHFILNALNTIGAQMEDKPEAETVLSRLGESINIIFGHAQQQKIAHAFADEWVLLKNIILIHQLMYLKKLEVTLPNENILVKFNELKIPLGLLQIPVENALLHGLSNKEEAPWHLKIDISETETFVFVTITDNGVGRRKAATLSNHTKHGTGTKNIDGILAIVNAANKNKITIEYKDDIFEIVDEKYGTSVIISIPKTFNYDSK